MKRRTLTAERAKEAFDYNPETGELKWKVNSGTRARAGTKAGNIYGRKTGYYQVSIDGDSFLVHRLVWLIHYGKMPTYDIDHINGNGLDNRIENLRDVPDVVNRQNCRKRIDNQSGITGINWNKRAEKWMVQIGFLGKNKYQGCFSDIGEAIRKRNEVLAEYGFSPDHGKDRDFFDYQI